MPLILAGLGTSVPPHRASQEAAAEFARFYFPGVREQLRLLPALYRRAGVHTRHSVLLENSEGPITERQSFYTEATADAHRGPSTGARMRQYEAQAQPLALQAEAAALADSGLSPREITHLITVSCSGFSAPGVDIGLIQNLPLRPTVARTHVGFMGCHGALNGLRVAQAFAAQPDARVLLCAVELCTLHLHYSQDADKIVANSLFADGAAAFVLHASRGEDRPVAATWQVLASGSMVIPDSTEAMSWRIGDHGFEMTLSPRVPELIHQYLPGWLEDWLGQSGLSLSDVQSWAVHPGGPRILSAVEESLALPPAALQTSREVLAEFGNMSSPTVLFIIDRLRRAEQRRPCVVLGFGPGLVVEAALLV
jgi:predicted naringenin-chalcone synthase